jgi:hypothetical protein
LVESHGCALFIMSGFSLLMHGQVLSLFHF